MYKIFEKFLKKIANSKAEKKKSENEENVSKEQAHEEQVQSIFPTIDENLMFLDSHFGNGIGLVKAKYDILQNTTQIGLVYIESVSDKVLIGNQIIEPLLRAKVDTNTPIADIVNLLQTKFICTPDTKKNNDMNQVIESLLNGSSVLFINGMNEALKIESRKLETRSIEKPENEATMLASMDALTENISTNCSLVIRRLPTPDIRFEKFIVGKLSRTEVRLIYIKDICDLKVIEEVKNRIQRVNTDIVDGIGTLSELIQDSTLSLFPKYKQTQRPDVIARTLTEGHFALLCSNSPYGMIAPISFWDNMKTMDDYADKPFASSYLRLVRLLAFTLSILISPLYLAFVTYNHSIVPASLALNITMGREGVPFPSFVEVLVMTLSITIIREASQRIPGAVGFFIGSLAAVVIGQATVSAGYVSGAVIIVVAVSEISSFAVSSTTLLYASRLLNYFLILWAGIFGMFGVINGVAIIIWHIVSLESFGVPYAYPLVPFDINALKDTSIRSPFSKLKKRFNMLVGENKNRMEHNGDKNKK